MCLTLVGASKDFFEVKPICYNRRGGLVISKQATIEQKVTNHTNYHKRFPLKVCIYCGNIIEE
ncbi:hypothetical protein QF028_000106 [Neobacillus sp. B4I6]